jgi:uncharacterized protein YbjQ (UPF0145 family)
MGTVTGEAVLGTNAFWNLLAGLRDITARLFAGYEWFSREMRETATERW